MYTVWIINKLFSNFSQSVFYRNKKIELSCIDLNPLVSPDKEPGRRPADSLLYCWPRWRLLVCRSGSLLNCWPLIDS